MAYMSIFSPNSMNLAQYSEAMKRLKAAGAGSPPGRIMHVCYGEEPKLCIITVWDTKEDFRAMAPTLLPILKDVGIELADAPEIYTVHDIELK